MESVVKIASYICQRYQKDFGTRIDEMKLHKLLYFVQRECIIQTGKPMFADNFVAWKYGPVLECIRSLYKSDLLTDTLSDDAIARYESIFDKIFSTYAPKTSMSLSILSHNEYSWRHARQGLTPDARCDVHIDIQDIEKDAERIKVRRFLLNRLG